MRHLVAFAIVGLALGVTVAADPSPKDRFEKLKASAKANLETPEGQAYDKALAATFEKDYGSMVTQCFQTTKHPDLSALEMVFTVAKDGKIRETAVWPETNIAKCLRGELVGAALPVPPSDGYLAFMSMNFKP